MKCIYRSCIVTVLTLLPALGFAWGAAGHMVLSHVADDNLTSAARTQVQDLLGTQTMADVSSWADEERSRHRDQAGWHYIDWEITDGSLLPDSDKNGTVLDAISSQGKILADGSQPKDQRKRALMYVIHFVGDMHQPLHCSDNYDKGGNEVQVNILGQNQNLHRAWDGTILNQVVRDEFVSTGTSLRAFATIINNRFADEATTAVQGTVKDWAVQNHRIARQIVYSYMKRPDFTTGTVVTLDDSYYQVAKPVIQRQLAIGGRRLAQVLNELLDPAVEKRAAVHVPNHNHLTAEEKAFVAQ